MDWKFFDKIYCINLYECEDRYIHIKNIDKKYNMNIQFYRTYRNKNGAEGCFNSHIEIIKEAYDKKYSNIIILEDDINPYNLTQNRLDSVIDFIKNNKFDIFYLGICPEIRKDSKIIDKKNKIYSVKSLGTHAYILNKNSIEKLITVKYKGIPLDNYYNEKFIFSYGIFPSLFYQYGFKSSIVNGFNVHNSISSKGVVLYTKCAEKYCYYIGISIYKLILIFIFSTVLLIVLNFHFILIIFTLFLILFFIILFRYK